MALAKKHRLSKKDIDRLFKQGKAVKGGFFFIRFSKNDLGFTRAAAIVPIKVAKKSVARNKLKRIITETIRTRQFLKNSCDVVVVATLSIVGKQLKEIKRDLEHTLNKIFVYPALENNNYWS